MAALTGLSLLRELRNALGLEPVIGIREIVIRARYDSAAEADVTFLVQDEQGGQIAELVKRYQLVDRESAP